MQTPMKASGGAKVAQSASTPIIMLVAAAFFMENLDGSIIATAIPQMAQSFGTHVADMSLGITAYLLTLAVFIPISGWTADRFGVRTVFTSAIVLFTVASILCGITDTFGEFVAARVFQGIGGAMMVPVGRLAVLRSTPKAGLMRAIAIVTWPGLIAPVLGPPLGGFLTTYFSWRWIFYLNVPLGVVGVFVSMRLLDNRREQDLRSFDIVGFILCGIGCATLLYAMELIGRGDVSLNRLGLFLTISISCLGCAWLHLKRVKNGAIDLSTLKIRTFAVVMGGGSLFRISISAVPFLLPLMFQVGFGMDAFRSGLLTLAVFVGNLLMKVFTTRIVRRFGFRSVLLVNGVIASMTLGMTSLISAGTPTAIVFFVLFVGGLARSLQFTALNTLSFADVPKSNMSAATSFSSTVQQLSVGIGVAAGAMSLQLSRWMSGHGSDAMTAGDFQMAFLFVAAIGLLGVVDVLGLPRDAGAVVSGHRTAESTLRSGRP
ncbi:drug resistance transporter, EmrB/QacA subfamily (plasmid) [Paraburkholderia phymatum STM815]|uniref:Drug resistance transporter, EmrB/QacA subfamily n=2 Tax=Paraburkholderia phymatum TaxID=148447 RepID=B2JTF9_PARP8|nr:drug resistance transporter, EmrB/QacA subfamily [Paraburkholderia phymatum STM815]